MQLKEFQKRTLAALQDYFRACVEKRNAILAFYETTLRRYGLGVPYNPAPELPHLPYICLRLPTGGGKTLCCAHSIAIAKTEYLHTDEPLVLWLRPPILFVSRHLKHCATVNIPIVRRWKKPGAMSLYWILAKLYRYSLLN